MTRPETFAAIADLLKSQSTLALATFPSEGFPHVTPLFYLPEDDLRLYWLSSAASKHSRTLKSNPAAAVTVYRPVERWREIRGVQMRGTASAVADPAVRRDVAQRYARRFHLGKVLQAGMARSGLYVFQPSWARYIDNSRRFGERFEIRIAPAGRLT